MGILQDLKTATDGLLYSSESDAPLKPFLWPQIDVGEILDPAALLGYLELDPQTPVEPLTAEQFFAPMLFVDRWATDEDREIVLRFVALVELLGTALKDTRVYRVGAGLELSVYVIGQTSEGDWAGVTTQLTET